MKMVYSGADPRLELLQTVAGTVWTPADSGVHHIGYWSDDVESDLATMESHGLTYEVKSYNPDGSGTLLWAYAKGPTGPRIELVSRGMEPFIAYWWSTAGGESQWRSDDHFTGPHGTSRSGDGASSGIGEATARALIARGAKVAMLARRAERLDTLRSPVGERAIGIPCDVTDLESLRAGVDAGVDAIGGLDAVITVAGRGMVGSIVTGDPAGWRELLDVNLIGPLATVRYAVPHFCANDRRDVVLSGPPAPSPPRRALACMWRPSGVCAPRSTAWDLNSPKMEWPRRAAPNP
jgi:short chain dehydrogenase/Glyoxalase/Bleomycin resistance protein/Dioxygenase superfamily